MSSPFAKAFKKHEYDKALRDLDELANRHPNDPLIMRYRAATLERLGRTQEAISLYQKLLAEHPKEASARVFLGRAYVRKGNHKAAAREFRRVAANTGVTKEYRGWAHAELNRLRHGAAKPKPKRFYFVGKTGIAYDSNPLVQPNDKSLRSRGGKKRGADFIMEWTAGFVPLAERDARVDILYIGQETLHDGGTSRVNFHSEGFAVVGKKRYLVGRRAFLLKGRYDFRANFLRSDLFSISNRFFLGADTSFVKRTRTHVYTRFNILNFGPDGSIPSRTSRDGFRFGTGITQYVYTADLRRYLFVKEEFNLSESRGDNFDRRGMLSRIGIHTPVDPVKKLDLDVSGGFDFGAYPDFSSLSRLDLDQREDKRWDIYSGLTYHLRPAIALRAFYRFIKSVNDNGFFDRDRHIAGGEVIFGI